MNKIELPSDMADPLKKYHLRNPMTKVSDQVLNRKEIDLPRGTEGRDKEQRQEIEEESEGEGNQGKGQVVCPRRQRTASPYRETDGPHRKMVVYKGTRGNPVLDEVFNFNQEC